MRTPTADKLADSLLAAKKKHDRAKNLALAVGMIFWVFTGLTVFYVFRDVESFFANSNRARVLLVWLIPAAVFVITSRRVSEAAGDWKEIRKTAIQKVNPEFCSHQVSCRCRQDFLEEMKDKGIDLYL